MRASEHRFGAVASMVVLAALLASVAGATPVWGERSGTEASGLIAFTRSDGIYVVRPDGSGLRALRRGGFARYASGLAWSPDGRRLVFAVDTGPADPERGIWVVGAGGRHPVHLLTGRVSSPTWSPDGGRIAFGWRSAIWVVDADGSHRRQLRANPGFPASVDWSPAGNRIAFSFFDYVPAVYVMDENGGHVRRLATGSQPDWSPDGRRIAFTYGKRDATPMISVMAASGRHLETLGKGLDPEWSPDGRKIALVRGDAAASELYVTNADGTGLTRLTHNRTGERFPAWQPTGAP